MNILITNSVPLNGGDEALLRATVESLQRRWPDSNITILCSELELSRQCLPDLNFASDLEFVRTAGEWSEVEKLYRRADVILSAPGGFLHDFYALEDRLRGFEIAIDLGKPVVVFAQSLGPFWKPESLRRIPEVLNRVSKICVRDAVSKQHLLNCGVAASKIVQTADAAFLWRNLAADLFRFRKGPVKKIGLCFRVWPPRDHDVVKDTVAKAVQLCRHLLAKDNCELVFLSTCQGISGYTDDSLLALEIVAQLPVALHARCKIDRSRYAPRQLIAAFSECDAFIGMRLHGCILSMLGGTPAMGLAYEQKTPEIFQQLHLGQYQIPFESPYNVWLESAERFLADVEQIHTVLPENLDRLCQRALTNLDVVDSVLSSREIDAFPAEEKSFPRFLTSFDKLRLIIPPDAIFILVDEDQLNWSRMDARALPFLEKDGVYWGLPENDQQAIAELERLRRIGAAFIVFVEPCLWWLEHYGGFHEHLRSNFCSTPNDANAVIFDLR